MSAAVNELQRIFKAATGATLSVATDNQAIYDENSKYISVGDTAYAQSAGVSYDGISKDGYKLSTRGKSLFITGGNSYGAFYGTQGLMKSLFNYEYYHKDTESYSLRDRVILEEIEELSSEPDFAHRAAGYGTMWAANDVYDPNRYGVKIYTNYFAPVNGQIFHNSFGYLPKETYGASNPDWYATTGTQLCYTARGNSEQYKAMVSKAVEEMQKAILANPDMQYIGFIGQDNHDVCACGTCAFYTNYYGSVSGTVILFINDVNAKIRAWISSENIDTDIQICIMAYLGYYQAPTKNIDQLQLQEGIATIVAPIEIEYDEAFNQTTKDNFNAWKAVSSHLGFWLYDSIWSSANGVNYQFIPFDSFTGMQERYAFVQSLGAEFLFVQGQSETYGLQSGFNNLKMYLNSKLAWDTETDVAASTQSFFDAFYGEASTPMKKYYDDLIAYMQTFESKGTYGEPYGGWTNKSNWAQADILRWVGYIDEALAAIEPLKTQDSALYEKYHRHIVAERIDLNYMLFKYYGDTSVQAELKADIIESGVQHFGTKGEALYDQLVA